MLRYCVGDFETEEKEVFKRTANCFYNDIIAYSFKTEDGQYTAYDSDLERLRQELEHSDVFVAHNAKFEVLYLLVKTEWFRKWLLKGGRIFCTAQAHYILSSFKEHYPPLREIAVRDYDCPKRIKNIDELLFNFKSENLRKNNRTYDEQLARTIDLFPDFIRMNIKYMRDVPEHLVLEDVSSDVQDTESVYLQQLEKIKNLGLEEGMNINMEYLLATCELEYNGMYINKDRLQTNKQKLEERLKEVEDKLQKLIEKYWVI